MRFKILQNLSQGTCFYMCCELVVRNFELIYLRSFRLQWSLYPKSQYCWFLDDICENYDQCFERYCIYQQQWKVYSFGMDKRDIKLYWVGLGCWEISRSYSVCEKAVQKRSETKVFLTSQILAQFAKVSWKPSLFYNAKQQVSVSFLTTNRKHRCSA